MNLLSGVVTADAIKAVSSTTKKGTYVLPVECGDRDPRPEDQRHPGDDSDLVRTPTRSIPGVGTLYLRRSMWSSTGLDVIALQLVLGSPQGGLPAGAVVTAGYAQSGVV